MERQRTLSRVVDASEGAVMKENITIKNAHAHLPVQALWLLVPVEGLGVLAILAYVATHWQLFVQQTTAIMAWLALVVSMAAYLGLIYLLVRVVRSGIEALVALVQGLMGAYRQFEEARSVRTANKVSQALLHAGNNVVVYRNQAGEIIVKTIQQEKYNYSIRQIDAPGNGQQQLPPPKQGIPDVIRYEDVADAIPEDMSLLGIHPSNGDLELTLWEKLKCLWVVGSSSTGKSNTVFGKAREAVDHSAKLLPVDQHAGKDDSLARKLAPLKSAFLRPVAVKDNEVLDALNWFKTEFERRVNCPCGQQAKRCAACSQKIVLICDEMNRMVRNEALVKPLKEIVAICGEESRGFGMYGWFLSQKCAHLKWLRDSAITVIVHRLTRFEEALLACNDDRAAAKQLLTFKIGRTFVYGVDFDGLLELQQPLYDVPDVIESDLSYVESEEESDEDIHEVQTESLVESTSSTTGDVVPIDGEPTDRTFPFGVEKFRQAQKLLLAQRNQNDIICEVWNVQENTRAFRSAKEEFRQMLAYLASMAGEV